MIKLINLLKEVQAEKKLSPKDQEQYKQALAILQDETLDEGIKDSLKKLGLSAAVIMALMASPQLTSAQKAIVKDLKAQTSTTQVVSTVKTNPNFWVKDTNDIKKIQSLFKVYRAWTLNQWENGLAKIVDTSKYYSELTPTERENIKAVYMSNSNKTDADGLNGQYTSTFIFPNAFLKDLNAGTTTNLGIKGNESLKASLKAAKGILNMDQLRQWNEFGKYMKSIKVAGTKEMNNKNFSNKILKQYKEQQ